MKSILVLALLIVACTVAGFDYRKPYLWTNQINPTVTSLLGLQEKFGHFASTINAKGKVRGRNDSAAMLDRQNEWEGLLAEPLRDTIADVLRKCDETNSKYSSLRSTFFSEVNPFIEQNTPTSLSGFVMPWTVPFFDGWTVWMRCMLQSTRFSPIGFHAHPDAGIYVQLVGTKTFLYMEDWQSELQENEWDSVFPLVFANPQEVRRKEKQIIKSITIRAGDVLYQPAWLMHKLEYDGVDEFISLRTGFVSIKYSILDHPALFLKSIPMYLQVGLQIAMEWLYTR